MTSLVSPLTRVAKAGVNGADFTALESSVATNIAKPTSGEVDGQIDQKNADQLLQINLDYADRPTTYKKSEVYNKTESDASLALKGSAAGLSTVTAYANSLPTLSTVDNVINAHFIVQDSNNFVTYGAKSTVTANTAQIAVNTAAATTNQSSIAAANANIASILSGDTALETLNVFDES